MDVMLENLNNLLFVGKNELLVEFLFLSLSFPIMCLCKCSEISRDSWMREILVKNHNFFIVFPLHFSAFFGKVTSAIFSEITPYLLSSFSEVKKSSSKNLNIQNKKLYFYTYNSWNCKNLTIALKCSLIYESKNIQGFKWI